MKNEKEINRIAATKSLTDILGDARLSSILVVTRAKTTSGSICSAWAIYSDGSKYSLSWYLANWYKQSIKDKFGCRVFCMQSSPALVNDMANWFLVPYSKITIS